MSARWLERLLLCLLSGLALFGAAAHVLLLLRWHVPDLLLPAALLAGLLIPWRGRASDAAESRAPRWLVLAVLALLGIAVIAVAFGALATPSRHWDGAVAWDAKASFLAQDFTLEQPFFRDGAVFSPSRDYPLLQPLLLAAGDRLLGGNGGRALFALVYVLLALLVGTALRRANGNRTVVWLGTAALMLTPILVNPTSGGIDSGYGEAFLLLCTTAMAAGLLLGEGRYLFLGALLAVMVKPEGLVYAGAAAAAAFCSGQRPLLRAAAAGLALGSVLWLPVQHRLMNGGADSRCFTIAGALLLLWALLELGDLAARRAALRERGRILAALVLAPALALAVPFLVVWLGNRNGTMEFYLGDPARPLRRLERLPAIAAGALQYGLLRGGFGLAFWLPCLGAVVAWRRRQLQPVLPLLLFLLAGLLIVQMPFLLSQEEDLRHHLRSSMPRLQLHWLGAAMLLGCATIQASATVLTDLWRALVPRGTRRDRWLWMGWLVLRKLRDGPGPWWRAVRTGLLQQLPVSWQDRWLRRHLRHRAPTAAAPAVASAGVEVQGRVSVVLPVYQQAGLLATAIDSVLAQTFVDLELIVIDDGSGPEVAAVLDRYAGERRLRRLRQDNRGLPAALDAGFELASGEFWCWTSADNLMLPQCLERLVAFLQQHRDVAMVFADYELIDDGGAPIVGGEIRVNQRHAPGSAAVDANRDLRQLGLVQDNFVGPCFLYRGSVGRLLGRYEPQMGLEDYDYWLRLSRQFRLQHLGSGEVLYRYRIHEDSLTARARELRLFERGGELLRRERQRQEWDGAPLRVVAAAGDAGWLQPMLRESEAMVTPGEAATDAKSVAAKSLWIADAGSCRTVLPAVLPAAATAAVFAARAEDAYGAGDVLARGEVLTFAADAVTAARAAVFSGMVLTLPPGQEALELARRFAAERSWQRRTSTAAVAPAPEVPCREPLAVLLQADRFTQGGLERVVLDAAAELQRRGAAVGLLVLGERGAAVDEAGRAGLQLCRLPARPSAADYRALLREGGWQLVSAHDSVFGADVAAAAGVPFVQTLHNTYAWFPPERIAAYRGADPDTAAYVAVGARVLLYADMHLGLDVGKAVVVENGIAQAPPVLPAAERRARRAQFGIGDGDFLFLQVAAVGPVKAQRATLLALVRLRARSLPAKVLFVGGDADAWYGAALRRDIERLGLGDAAVVAGALPSARDVYALADAFVLPSVLEGCSLAIAEAAAAGLPVVATDVGAAASQLGAGDELVAPLCDPLQLDWSTLGRWLENLPEEFVVRLAAAMARVVERGRTRAPAALPWRLDRRRMADAWWRLFLWLRQGGEPAAARAWLRRPPAQR